MTSETSVVTPERFTEGFSYPDYIAQININRNWFEKLYDSFQVDPDDAEFFRNAASLPNGPAKLMVIGEDWCPDVYRGMPMMARIAEAGGMEMRVFPRDSHMDIMNEFLKEGKWASIPVAVFYTADHEYLCHWIERPALAEREMESITAQVRSEMPNASDQELRAAARPRNQERFTAWQQESVKEIRELLAKSLDAQG